MFLHGELRCEVGEPEAAVHEYKRYGKGGEKIESLYYCDEHMPKVKNLLPNCPHCGAQILP